MRDGDLKGEIKKEKIENSEKRSRYHNLLWKTMEKPKSDKMSLKPDLGSGVGYTWRRY